MDGHRAVAAGLDVERVRADFPILAQTVRGKPLVFLDSAASAQKPRAGDRGDDPLHGDAPTPTSTAAPTT